MSSIRRLQFVMAATWSIAALFASALPAVCQQDCPPPLRAHVAGLARPLLARGEAVGLVVGVVEGGRTYKFTFGRVEKGGARPDAQTEFEIGSVTKTFTGTLLALYVRRGLVRYDDPLQKYLPARIRVPAFGADRSPCWTWRPTPPACRGRPTCAAGGGIPWRKCLTTSTTTG
jgi:CubicO group peptidase (beta-lactamase class C family)